jgi:hypothetical protein
MSDAADKAIIGHVARMLAASAGTCKQCGCHGDACSLREGDKCVWVDKYRTLCSNPACLVAAGKAKRKRNFSRTRSTKGRAA